MDLSGFCRMCHWTWKCMEISIHGRKIRRGGIYFDYLVFLVLLGLPVLVCEFAVGRASRKSTARAFHDLEPEDANFHNFGYMSMVSNYVLMMFYTMVAGWMLYYCYAMAAGKLCRRKDSVRWQIILQGFRAQLVP